MTTIPLGTRAELSAAGYAGGWSPFANATPSQVQDAISQQLTAQGFNVSDVTVIAGIDTAIGAHQFPYTARIVVTTQGASPSWSDVTTRVRNAVQAATGQAANVANETAGDRRLDDPTSLFSLNALFGSLTTGAGLVIVGGLVLFLVLHELGKK